ncbi:MAG TPA: YicC/YloC family endoribonuclease, partial [Terriglobales bacterium]|nr:YicC/YloC family endoribonuclease [Terriglobales bacterium]
MPIHSMTGFAQARGQVNGRLGFALALKSVNHRFLDLHFRMPSDSSELEMKLRRLLKEKMARGHVEVTLTLQPIAEQGFAVNRQLVGGYVEAFRRMAQELGVSGEPDLNAALKLPGAMDASGEAAGDEELQSSVLATVSDILCRLNEMRAEEGRGMERELRDRLSRLEAGAAEVEKLRGGMLHAHLERLRARIQELVGTQAEPERILQEAALLAERSDIQEELVRLNTHIQHFRGLLDSGGEVGKKLDFLLQEMNREANTLLSKTTGVAGEALRITQLGLGMKAEIEKSREQVQNIE